MIIPCRSAYTLRFSLTISLKLAEAARSNVVTMTAPGVPCGNLSLLELCCKRPRSHMQANTPSAIAANNRIRESRDSLARSVSLPLLPDTRAAYASACDVLRAWKAKGMLSLGCKSGARSKPTCQPPSLHCRRNGPILGMGMIPVASFHKFSTVPSVIMSMRLYEICVSYLSQYSHNL